MVSYLVKCRFYPRMAPVGRTGPQYRQIPAQARTRSEEPLQHVCMGQLRGKTNRPFMLQRPGRPDKAVDEGGRSQCSLWAVQQATENLQALPQQMCVLVNCRCFGQSVVEKSRRLTGARTNHPFRIDGEPTTSASSRMFS